MIEIQEVSNIELAFPSSVERLMPKWEEIPKDFKNGHTLWNRLFNSWFFEGVKDLVLVPKNGVDQKKALRHVKAIMASFEPKHEHKEAAVAFLMSQWFESATFRLNGKSPI